MIEMLKRYVKRVKEQLKEEQCQEIKLGLYMALNSLRNDLIINGEVFLAQIGLEEELEKYL